MRVALKKILVLSLKASSVSGNFEGSTLMGPIWRHATEKLDGSSFKPSVWPHPPLRACEMWHATPGTLGSSKSLTHTLSLGESRLNVVLTQPSSSAFAAPHAATSSTTTAKIGFIRCLHTARPFVLVAWRPERKPGRDCS